MTAWWSGHQLTAPFHEKTWTDLQQQHHVYVWKGEIGVEQPWNDAEIFGAAWEMSWQCSQGEVC